MIRHIFAALLLATLASAAIAAPTSTDSDCYAAVAPLLRASGGTMTPEVRTAYLKWAESAELRQLKQSNASVSADCLAEIDHDDTLHDAIFGSVYPPDASVLQNYTELRKVMGGAFMAKYRSLAIGVAISKRTKGVESAGDLANIGHDYQPEFWIDQSLHIPGTDREKEYVKNIAGFMARSRSAALDIYQDERLQSQLKAYLTQQGVDDDLVGEVKKGVPFGERLKYAMVLLGQRPAARDPKPSTADWLRHTVEVDEATPISTPTADGKPMPWPLFPLKTAPWPLLMPLAHPVPLTEASYIWDAFQGLHGDDRYHTYGPYRDDDAAMPDQLLPSRWFWDAWPDRIVHGGECVPISIGTCELYSSLGKPAMWCGQPGHANLISFQRVDNAWTAEIEQEFAGGPEVTCAQWYFNEDPGTMLRFRDLYNWAGAEYQLGLALSMNVGLKSYMDTRIAANIVRAMPAADKTTVGVKLLRGMLVVNPYNPEIWYRLAEQSTDTGQESLLIEAALKHDAGIALNRPGIDPNVTADKTTASNQYWRALSQFVAQYGLLSHAPPADETAMHGTYALLKTVDGVNAEDLSGYVEKFAQTATSTDKAVDYDRGLASTDNAYGEVRMGERYRDGEGVAANVMSAKESFAKAARQGDQAAAVLLADLNPAIPADQITVTASSTFTDVQNPKHLVDGSGMVGSVHDNERGAGTMWHTKDNPASAPPAPGLAPSPAWVRFDFAQPAAFDAILIWNHNQAKLTDRGFRRTRIWGSLDGTDWMPLTSTDVVEVPQSTGDSCALPSAFRNQASGQPLKSVIIAAEPVDGNYGSSCFGLSAVRFVVRPLTDVIPAAAIAVTASSTYSPLQDPHHLIDGTGMLGGLHDNAGDAKSMWHCGDKATEPPARGVPYSPAWVRFDFTRPTSFDSLLIWNHNQADLTDRGFRKTHIYGSSDGVTWRPLTSTDTVEIPRANGTPTSQPASIPADLGGQPVKSVIIAADAIEGNYGGSCYGLSAVRFVRHSTRSAAR